MASQTLGGEEFDSTSRTGGFGTPFPGRADGDRLRRVVLYGSQALGEASPGSDVDVLVVLRGPIQNTYTEIKRTTDVAIAMLERYGLHFSLQPYTEATYEARQGPFIQNIHEEGPSCE